jgi:hypothetical protein
MRVLVTTQPGLGHFHPLVPIAQALQAAGHDVRIACAPRFHSHVEAAGFTPVAAGLDWVETAIYDTFPFLRVLPPSPRRALYVMTYVFPWLTARPMLADLLRLGTTWRPDPARTGARTIVGASRGVSSPTGSS